MVPRQLAFAPRETSCRALLVGNRAVALAVALATVGCASGPPSDSQRTVGEGAAFGALIGALLGAAAADNRRGAAVGAALGAAAGTAVGMGVADKKAAYARREDALRASADRAQALVAETRQANETLDGEIAQLQASVQRLRAEQMSAEAQRELAQSNQQAVLAAMGRIDQQLQSVRQEISRQVSLAQAEQKQAAETRQPVAEQGLRLVSAGVRDLQGQERALERARQQLLLLDPRRAY